MVLFLLEILAQRGKYILMFKLKIVKSYPNFYKFYCEFQKSNYLEFKRTPKIKKSKISLKLIINWLFAKYLSKKLIQSHNRDIIIPNDLLVNLDTTSLWTKVPIPIFIVVIQKLLEQNKFCDVLMFSQASQKQVWLWYMNKIFIIC